MLKDLELAETIASLSAMAIENVRCMSNWIATTALQCSLTSESSTDRSRFQFNLI